MTDSTWIVRLHPATGRSVDDLLRLPLSLDVWQRDPASLVVAVTEQTIGEIERRNLARVERISRAADYVRAASREDDTPR